VSRVRAGLLRDMLDLVGGYGAALLVSEGYMACNVG
jgi:hypothetical protein